MTDTPRKKLSLSGKTKLTLKSKKTSPIASNLKSRLRSKEEDSVTEVIKNLNEEVAALYEERKQVLEQIKKVSQRLLFARSEPLQDFLVELKEQDFKLMTQIVKSI